MRRAGLWLAISALFLLPAFAQETGNDRKAEESGSQETWRIVNFVLLAGGLGFLIVKNGGPFFAARSRKITEDLAQGEEARREAERRAAEVERRLSTLDTEIARLREESRKEADNQRERMRQETASELAKMQARTEQEIASAGKTARAELKRYSGELAIGIAEQKIRSRMNADTQDTLVVGFLGELEDPSARPRVN
jgi:F-type H+-transporting ATPase subunit b